MLKYLFCTGKKRVVNHSNGSYSNHHWAARLWPPWAKGESLNRINKEKKTVSETVSLQIVVFMHQQKPCKANKSLSIETTTLSCEAIKKNLKRVIKTNTINLIKTLLIFINCHQYLADIYFLYRATISNCHQSKAQKTFITLH